MLWSEDVFQIYRILLDNSQALKFGVPIQANRVVKTLRFGPIRIAQLYRTLDHFLDEHEAFQQPGSVLPFPYDWRDDLVATAERLGEALNTHAGTNYANSGAQRRLVIITHSMGALVARLAVIEKQIHPSNVVALIHMAPPLLGSAKAFRSAFGRTTLPMLSEFATWWSRLPNGAKVLENLCDTLLSFPSVFQLMPPVSDAFVEVRQGDFRSPFDPREVAIKAAMRKRAEYVHSQLDRFCDLANKNGLRSFVIAGVGNRQNTEVTYRAFPGHDRYWVINAFRPGVDFGDDTVSYRSASRAGQELQVRQAGGARHDKICDHRRAIDILATIVQRELWNPGS